MDLYETTTHSFIIKIWLEELAEGDKPAIWRGHITHVPGEERRYIMHPEDILLFISPYLEKMGVKFAIQEAAYEELPQTAKDGLASRAVGVAKKVMSVMYRRKTK